MEVSLANPIITEEMRSEVDRVLQKEFFVGGETVIDFEDAFADYVGTNHAIAVDSGTRALQLALEGAGIGEGDTVVTTSASFIATANAIHHTGADICFVDVDLETYTLDLEHLEQLVASNDVDAVVPVHLYGYPAPIPTIRDIVGNIPIIADSCQAHGATLDGKKIGALSTVGCFSFYPSKNMTVAGDGGMITTDDDEVAAMARSLRDVGRGDGTQYEHERIGYTARLNTVSAAVGLQQLEHLDKWNKRRREIAAAYSEGLKHVDDIILPPEPDYRRSSAWYFYVIRTDNRDALRTHLEENGVETGIQYATPIHLQPPYREQGHSSGAFPDAEQWGETVLSLPVHPRLTDDEVAAIIDLIAEFYRE